MTDLLTISEVLNNVREKSRTPQSTETEQPLTLFERVMRLLDFINSQEKKLGPISERRI